MSKTQKWVLLGVIVVIVAMLIFQPFFTYDEKGAVNVVMLAIEWFVVFIVGAIAYFIVREEE